MHLSRDAHPSKSKIGNRVIWERRKQYEAPTIFVMIISISLPPIKFEFLHAEMMVSYSMYVFLYSSAAYVFYLIDDTSVHKKSQISPTETETAKAAWRHLFNPGCHLCSN